MSAVTPESDGSVGELTRPPTEARQAGLSVHIWSAQGLRLVHSLDELTTGLVDPATRLWIDVEDASHELLGQLTTALGLHDLVAEDIIERRQRARIVVWDDGLHLVLFAMAHHGQVIGTEVDIVLASRFLVTSHPAAWRPIEALRVGPRGVGNLLAQGTDMLLYAVIDPIIDGYFPVVDDLSDEIDALEDVVVSGADGSVMERLLRVRRNLLEMRHLVGPEREVLDRLSDRDMALVDPARHVYFRDLYERIIRVTDELDTHRELAAAVLDTYLTSVNNNLSDVMKRLTAITAVLAGVGAAAGIFGMSEAASALNLPTPIGFWVVVGVLALIGVLVFAYFRRIDWI